MIVIKSNYPPKPGIYLLTNIINNKVYVGKATHLGNRISCHKNSNKPRNLNNNMRITRAIRKYGWQNFTVGLLEVFDILDNNNLLDLEERYISEYNALDPVEGYNTLPRSNDLTGIPCSESRKRKISEANSKKSGPECSMYGRKHSEQTKQLMSQKAKGVGKLYLRRAIKQIDPITNEVIKIWDYAGSAAQELSKNKSCKGITSVANGHKYKKTAHGFKWEFVTPKIGEPGYKHLF